jgi:hypothetical protein
MWLHCARHKTTCKHSSVLSCFNPRSDNCAVWLHCACHNTACKHSLTQPPSYFNPTPHNPSSLAALHSNLQAELISTASPSHRQATQPSSSAALYSPLTICKHSSVHSPSYPTSSPHNCLVWLQAQLNSTHNPLRQLTSSTRPHLPQHSYQQEQSQSNLHCTHAHSNSKRPAATIHTQTHAPVSLHAHSSKLAAHIKHLF